MLSKLGSQSMGFRKDLPSNRQPSSLSSSSWLAALRRAHADGSWYSHRREEWRNDWTQKIIGGIDGSGCQVLAREKD
ncbi:hypothetical protein JAAARDRAFT_576241 [Jaapia argillacea MUCL 33604]|uniref:Uncharacterized protein n=1 Tax=Jaapia argillacea MUCL 33604 TaxID=933084 RepID=A0A067Q507_9AGAM|nr:hypothetical protein JAAARDRAFT_576241 [Jaapia argillacea MUCL 33604]